MSATYLAWNGQSYPWPPPEGWYEAADGRWWALGSGPDPTPGDRFPDEARPNDTAPGLESRAAVSTAAAPATAEPTDPATNLLGTETPASPVDDQSTIMTNHPTQVVGPPPGPDRIGTPTGPTRPSAPPPGVGVWQAPLDQGGSSRLPIIAGAAVLAACIVGAVAVFAIGVGDQSADPELPALSGATDTTAVGADSEARSGDPAGSQSDVTEAAVDTTSSTTTTIEATTTTAAPSIDTLTDQEKVEAFRSILDLNGLSGELLADEDLIEFGTTFCIFAIGADDFDDYVRFRQEAIGQSDSELTEDELAVAVDGAVSTFCPDDAVRLGIRPADPAGTTTG